MRAARGRAWRSTRPKGTTLRPSTRPRVATSRDGAAWRKWPSDAAPRPVLDRGASNHVNDPSVVRAGGRWSMFYTDAPTAENDRIWLAQSDGLTGFARVG